VTVQSGAGDISTIALGAGNAMVCLSASQILQRSASRATPEKSKQAGK
jgi:hypothetical protein